MNSDFVEDKKFNSDSVNVFWWDKKVNFGDLIGPWLVGLVTGKSVSNISNNIDIKDDIYISVGSLISSLDRPGYNVWGTGSICRLGQPQIQKLIINKPGKIFSLRGELTANELSRKLNWDVPRIYGDPALVLPYLYRPSQSTIRASRPCVVPHFSHKKYFLDIGPDIDLIDVESTPRKVVDAIASSSVCISTSLHGIIIAQAYQVPWVWVRFPDSELTGAEFKFEDFFSVLERQEVASCIVEAKSITEKFIKGLSLSSRLPRNKYNFKQVLDACPWV